MRNRKVIMLIASVTAGCFLFLSGCGVDLTNIAVEETTLSAEMENEDLTDGECQIHSVFYQADNSLLSGASVTILVGGTELFTGTTDDSGSLEGFTIPANTPAEIVITDASGSEIGRGVIVCKLSSSYDDITIYPVHGEEDKELVLDVPLNKTDMRAAIFLTDNGKLSIANVCPYVEKAAPVEGEVESDEGDAAPAEGDTAPSEGDAAPAEGDTASAEGDAAPAEGEAAPAEGDTASAEGDTTPAEGDAQ